MYMQFIITLYMSSVSEMKLEDISHRLPYVHSYMLHFATFAIRRADEAGAVHRTRPVSTMYLLHHGFKRQGTYIHLLL